MHNLLSVGKLLSKGYSVMFDKDKCTISNNQGESQVISIPRSRNNMFPLDIARIEGVAMTVRGQALDELWHLRYGHLNYRSFSPLA